ncbi:hypothetical protein CC78DRAFT_309383 [Lojkania enalia]|uniref:Uncharacterized protein n=1 Tax=Lojkania enalia TaxID=147567 RepID=A0A9P4N1S5_9PLEO|nr:hypothetical protein CC78DRAFT_309383 [Didymosphaeria enalia]
MNSQASALDVFWDTDAREEAYSTTSLTDTISHGESVKLETPLSLFESVITSYPPILESLLAQIPTTSFLNLYHTSKYLRDFLRSYPVAWKTLSFRLPQPAVAVGTPGSETPDGRERQSKTYSFDALLKQVIQPYGTRLMSLDLCNTAVSGIALVGSVLAPRSDTLRHLSVRGCKNVSIKYHIVPFLEPYTLKNSPWVPRDLALKSLYTYRCRHHRRRPYLPSSLIRRDSDSDPTHQLIEICHQLGIWTDTAWCPTPGGRCYRRKDYHAGRAGPQNMEVWVPFDRLWRSSNRLGSSDGHARLGRTDGRLWEVSETGQDGEPLGTDSGVSKGEGKHIPAHLRKSHTIFVEDVKCAQCNDLILERCESCSVRMHCMGCRKTLCASCAFNRPLKKRAKTSHFTNLAFGPVTPRAPVTNRFWWALGATRSPNLMDDDDDSSDSDDGGNALPIPPANREPPKLNMHWCCLEPIFSGGGGIAVLGTGLGGRGADKIRAAPLPRTKQFEDPDFSNQLRPVDYVRELKNNGLYEYVLGEDVDILSCLKQESLELQAETCPRGLCHDCYRSFRWKVSCRCCKTPLCKEHDFRGLKFRKCGFREMHTERDYARTHNEPVRLVIPEFNPNKSRGKDPETTPTADSSLQQSSSIIGTIDPEASDAEPMSQSQILFPQSGPSAVNMSTSTSMTSHDSMIEPSSSSTLPFVPVSSSRPRSFSASGVRSRNSGSWPSSPRAPINPINNPLPLPCNPRHPVQWEGCGSYFCQYPRPIGDNRAQCPAILKECSGCAVLVCDACIAANPGCTCSFCTVNFHCPHCARKKEVKLQCRLEAEIQERKEAELRAQEKRERDKEERGHANGLAEAVHEFFAFLDPGEATAETITLIDIAEEPDLQAELPVPSPDSITVTMEFAVTQEPTNVTVITSSGSSSIPDVAEPDATVHSDMQVDTPLPTNTTAPPSTPELTIEGEDVDFEEGLDAESALIDEFIDDGALTPMTAMTAEQQA